MALRPERIAVSDYSQGGEGQIIANLLGFIPESERDRTCVEVGAADGIALSNTRHLAECFGYQSTLIECNADLFELLKKNALPGSRLIRTAVGWQEHNGLDGMELPPTPDFISIDVDGCDYWIWHAMHACRPKIICIEHNPTIPNEVDFVQEADFAVHRGSSLKSLVALGKEKGYELADVTTFNAFFVDSAYFPLLRIPDNRLSTLRPDPPLVTYLFSGYDGHVFLVGKQQIPWHPVRLREAAMQAMPKRLQKYQLTRWEQAALRAWESWRDWKWR